MVTIDSSDALQAFVAENPAALLYFSAEGCGVCTVLLPKVEALLREEFPRAGLARIDCSARPELAAQQGVFAVPTLVLFFDGREAQRFARNVSLGQLREAMARPYRLLLAGDEGPAA